MSNSIQSILKNTGVYLDNITVDSQNYSVEYIVQHPDNPNWINYENIDMKVLATLDLTQELITKIANKGVFETKDAVTNTTVSIQFYKHIPFSL